MTKKTLTEEQKMNKIIKEIKKEGYIYQSKIGKQLCKNKVEAYRLIKKMKIMGIIDEKRYGMTKLITIKSE